VPERVLEAGEQLAARYRIEAQIGRGGMARLYRAVDDRLGRPVAVKVLSAPYVDQPQAAGRFLAEARTAASISHPNLVHVYDSGVDRGAHYIVMELLDGYRSLREELEAGGPLPPERAVDIGLEVLEGLGAVHRRDLVHRDVKAANVMVGSGPVKLIDFGIAEAAGGERRHGTSIGSLPYMAPEQLRGEPVTARSDLYALGVVLYEALTGRLPFEAGTPKEMLAAQRVGPIPPGHLAPMPPRLNAAILQVLRPDEDRRFADAAAMRTALRSVSEIHDDTTRTQAAVRPPDRDVYVAPLAGPPPSPRRAPGPLARERVGPRGWIPVALGIALGLILAGGLIFAVLNLGMPLPPGGASSPTPAGTPTVQPGMVVVPNTIGMSEAEAEDAARAAGLRWMIFWQEEPGATPGIYDQEPPAGTLVAEGSRLTMYSYRVPD